MKWKWDKNTWNRKWNDFLPASKKHSNDFVLIFSFLLVNCQMCVCEKRKHSLSFSLPLSLSTSLLLLLRAVFMFGKMMRVREKRSAFEKKTKPEKLNHFLWLILPLFFFSLICHAFDLLNLIHFKSMTKCTWINPLCMHQCICVCVCVEKVNKWRAHIQKYSFAISPHTTDTVYGQNTAHLKFIEIKYCLFFSFFTNDNNKNY